MRITAPISKVEEISVLASAGADEFYCGVVPPEWVAKYRTVAVNRRIFGNLPGGYPELETAVSEAHACGCRLFLVLNAQHYPGEQLDGLIDVAQRFAKIGGDALIVADLALLATLAAQDLGLALHVSSVASCRNKEAARFYQAMGAKRVIFPRDITLDEIAHIAGNLPDLELEAFVLNDGCVFEEGVCHGIHLPNRMGGPFCLDNYAYRHVRRDGMPLSDAEAAHIAQNDADYRKWLWYRMGCGFSVAPNGLPYGPCGLCAIPALHQAGVAAIKIAGREAPTERKIRSVQMVRGMLDMVQNGTPPEDAMSFARGLRGEPNHCDVGYMCYYPEATEAVDHARLVGQGV